MKEIVNKEWANGPTVEQLKKDYFRYIVQPMVKYKKEKK